MKPVAYSEEAENDLFEIGVYSWVEWGQEQSEIYHDRLIDACEHIIPRKLKFARAVAQRPGLLRWRCERHLIYFRVEPDCILIVRILHERMLPQNHL